VAAVIVLDVDQICREARLAYINAGPGPQRAPAAEAILIGQRLDAEVLRACAEAALRDLRPGNDVHASADYRRQLARVLTVRAISKAL
jgi:carbon-monoxide dehydrogenase medium subunit